MRLLLGLIKGAIVGGAVGYGAYAAGLGGGFNWITYAVVGGLVGLFVGRPIWSHLADKNSTVFTPVIKALFGGGIAIGLYALVGKIGGAVELTFADETRNVSDWPFVLGGAIGALYGSFLEWDDAAPKPKPDAKPADKA